ncbi:LTA synthase family protein [Streptococcus mutans]|uniref:LTA synthase family protein n=1 Tax=Streptococcus mutans TaxID=1309 RepID=UPI0038B91DE1
MKNYLKKVDWLKLGYFSLLLISIFFINFFTVNNSILSYFGKIGKAFIGQLGFTLVLFAIACLIIIFDLLRNLSWKFLGELGLGYLVYLIIAYFLLITRNLNNGKFKLWALEKNDFWQFDFLPILAGLLILAALIRVLFHHLKPHRLRIDFLKDYQTTDILLAGLISSVAINDSHYNAILRDGLRELIADKYLTAYINNFILALLLSLVGLMLVSYTTIQAIKDLVKNQPSFFLAFSTSVLLAVIFNYTLQLGLKNNGSLLDRFIFPAATLYQICFLIVVYLFIYFAINRFLLSTMIITSLGIVVSIVNAIKEGMRSEPLLITDFVWLQQADLIFGFVKARVIVGVFFILFILIASYIFLRKRILSGKIIKSNSYRGSLIAALLILSTSVYTVFRNEEKSKIAEGIPIISKINNWNNIGWKGFSTTARYKSLMYVWTKQLTKSIIDTPKDYSQAKIKEVARKYTKLAKKINKTRANNISDRTVIYILSESFSDPWNVPSVTLSQDVMPNIRQIGRTTTSGLMKSDGFGGGTANMEFQTLTGLPFYNFSSSVSTLYTEVVPSMSVFPSISDQFKSKNRIVIHPENASNYSRQAVYRKLNFNKFIAREGTEYSVKHVKREGINVSDQTTYENILDQLNPSQSQFFSVITMQNHIPWSAGEPEDVTASGRDFTQEQNNNLTSYSRLMSYTDTATKNFLDDLSKTNKDITVVFYGDHLPGLYPDSAFEDKPESKYQTNYFIWSNHKTQDLNYPLVNSSDFTAELLAHTDSKVSPYYALLTEVLNNASVDKKKLTPKGKNVAKDLKLIQYDITIGKGYIRDDKNFFKIKYK